MLREPDLSPVPKVLDWHCETVERGTSITGIVVGRIHKYRCHIHGKISKPCPFFATDGKLPCPCEVRGWEMRDIGYLPIVTADRERIVVVLSSMACEAAKELCKQGGIYRFRRPKTVKSRIRIERPEEKEIPTVLSNMKPTRNQDILEYLCHVWQIHALTQFCGFTVRRPLSKETKHEITEPGYTPRFVHGVVRGLAGGIGTGEAA